MENIANKYVLINESRSTLTHLANILKTKNPLNKDISFNMLLVYEDVQEAQQLVTELAIYISRHAEKHHVYQCSESELDTGNLLQKWRRNAGAFFIFADDVHSLEQRQQLGSMIQQIPEIIFCMCISSEELLRALKQDDHLYYRVFSEHIHIDSANAPVITTRFLESLKNRGFETTDTFANDISKYISVVYPKADLKKDDFIKDLTRRVVNNHYGSGNESNLIDESSVPYYVKPAVSQDVPVEEPAVVSTQVETNPDTIKKPKRGAKNKKKKFEIVTDINKDIPRKGCKSAKTFNIVLLSLSTFSKTISESTYYYKGEEGGKYIYQLEPVIRMLSKRLLNDNPTDCLDQLVILSTEQTEKKHAITLPDGTNLTTSPLEYFKDRIRDYLNPDLADAVRFVTLSVNEEKPHETIKKTVDTLRELKDAHPSNIKVQLYVDRHGGFREFQKYLDAILYLIRNEFTKVESFDVKYTNSNAYIGPPDTKSIFDFVSGINEFTHYGRIDSLTRYYDSKNPELMNHIINIANGIQLCDIFTFQNGLNELKEYFEKPGAEDTTYLSIFKDAIRKDYQDLLTENRTTVSAIEWCLKKGFYQQALTLIEGAMPKELHECGVFTYSEELKDAVYNTYADKFEINAYIFNNSVTKDFPVEDRLNFLKNKDFLNTNITDLINKKYGTKKIQRLINGTEFQKYEKDDKKKVNISPSFCKISYNVNNAPLFYAFMFLHCSFKELRNRSNHAATTQYPISLDTLIQAINKYIGWAKVFEAYAKPKKS